ncbi:hypothetical protein ACFSRY_06925, partial [Pontibacter locisalis]
MKIISILSMDQKLSTFSFSLLIFNRKRWLFCYLILFLVAVVNNGVNAQTYSGPLVITKGGTYTGNWESRDSEVAAVEIRTNEPVIIEHANIRGAGPLVRSLGNSADITIR